MSGVTRRRRPNLVARPGPLDYPAILAFTLLATVVYVVINLAVDALYPLLDPRTRGSVVPTV